MSDAGLSRTRTEIAARRARAAEVAARRAAWLADDTLRSAPHRVVTVRCDLAGHPGGMPKMAEMILTRHGTFFVSRIPWAASDELTLRPWEREHLLGAGMDEATMQTLMDDDERLRHYLRRLDEWSAGKQPNGPRWLQDRSPHGVVEVIDLPYDAGRLGLWLRCPRHLDAYEEADPLDLIASACQ